MFIVVLLHHNPCVCVVTAVRIIARFNSVCAHKWEINQTFFRMIMQMQPCVYTHTQAKIMSVFVLQFFLLRWIIWIIYVSMSGKYFQPGWTNSSVRSLCWWSCHLCIPAPETRSSPCGEQPDQLSTPQGSSKRSEVTVCCICTENLCSLRHFFGPLNWTKESKTKERLRELSNVFRGSLCCYSLQSKMITHSSQESLSASRFQRKPFKCITSHCDDSGNSV